MNSVPVFARNRFVTLSLSVLLLGLCGCDESLPPRDQPKNFLVAGFSVGSTLLVIDPNPPHRRYDSVKVKFTVANRYDDVLADSAYGKATVDIWLKDDPTIGAHLEQQRILDHVIGGILILRPNESAVVELKWDGSHPRVGTIWTRYHSTLRHDGQGRAYYQVDPIRMVARGSIQPWKYVPAQSFEPIEFDVVYLVYPPPP